MSDDEDIILSELNDEDLVSQMFDDLYDGLKEEIEEGVNILLERKWMPYDVLTKALVGGMTIHHCNLSARKGKPFALSNRCCCYCPEIIATAGLRESKCPLAVAFNEL